MKETIDRLARWNVWANGLLAKTLRDSGGEPVAAMAAYQHILETEITWLRRMSHMEQPNVPLWGAVSWEVCDAWSEESRQLLTRFSGAFDESLLSSTFTYRNSTGREFTDQVEAPLIHMFMHSMQYRGEAAGFLNAAGHRVPDFDLIFWMRAGEPL